MLRNARAAGGEVHRDRGLVWSVTPGAHAEVSIPFPACSGRSLAPLLDAVLGRCRELTPYPDVGCWSLTERSRPTDLGVHLVARGFEWGWRPYWMSLCLDRLDLATFPPAKVDAVLVDEIDSAGAERLPYWNSDTEARMRALARARPRRVWRFAVVCDGAVLAHSTLHLTTGPTGVAGIFGVGVVPELRRQGLGRAVTVAALRCARDQGSQHAILNATALGEPLYRELGFHALGHGQTWWLHPEALAGESTAPNLVQLYEAVARGDLAALATSVDPDALDRPLANGLTPVQLAVTFRQPAAAEWLIEHGATLDAISAWDLGWKGRLRLLLVHAPDLVNRRSGRWRITPLHEAARRGDVEFARILLAAHPHLDVADDGFQSTPLGWARHFGQTEIAGLIERHQVQLRSS